MQLDLFNKTTRTVEEESKGRNFIIQLMERMESFSKNIIKNEEAKRNARNTTLINQIELENKTSLESSLKMIEKMNEIIFQYAEKNRDKGDLYYITSKNAGNNSYNVFKYQGDCDEKIQSEGMEFSKDAMANTAVRLVNNKFIVDKEATESINNEIIDSAQGIIKEQNERLSSYRKEGNLYCITNDMVYDRVFLTNLDTNERFEEIDFPQKLQKKVDLGDVVKFEDNKYELMIKSTYQHGVEVKGNNQVNNEKQEGTLYCVSENEYYVGLVNLNNGEEFEALDFPIELREKISEGMILEYEDGEYHIKADARY